MKLVCVRWVDSCGLAGGGWNAKSAAKGMVPDKVRSVGWLVAEKPKYVTLAAHVAEHCYDGVMCIPRTAISKVTEIKL